jgi:hemerythrin
MVQKISQVAYQPMNDIHNNEVKVLNELLEAIENNNDIENKFNIFLDDVRNHFNFEQNLMEQYNFFAKVPHKMEHDRIVNELEEIKNSNLSNEELLQYFNQSFIPWLENHINTMDTVTAGYFNMVNVPTN